MEQPPENGDAPRSQSFLDSIFEKRRASEAAQNLPPTIEKDGGAVEVTGSNDGSSDSDDDNISHPATKDDVLRHTIHVEDDPHAPAITARSVFLSLILSAFGGVISAIYYFKPQTILVSPVFLAVISYLLGEAMSIIIPRKGRIGRFLNPFPFNKKEHIAITVMANSASIAAYGIELLAVNRLWYNIDLNGGIAVFLLFSSQFLGFALAGLMRTAIVYPKNMMWPSVIPVNNMLEALHRPKKETRKQVKVFLIVFTCIFCWEIIPEWIFPLLTGVSVFCLANQNSATFTNIFGGSDGNEGLGLFSICFDWQYISGGTSPLYFPLESLISQGFGICVCIVVFSGLYYSNTWQAKSFPFLSQQMFSQNNIGANPDNFNLWNQQAVIGKDNRIDPAGLAKEGLPWLAASYVSNIITSNMMMSAGITHILLWNWNDVKPVLSILDPRKLIRDLNPRNWLWTKPVPMEPHFDPHYELLLVHKPVPNWWFGVLLLLSGGVGIGICYAAHSTLPWWGFIIACIVAWLFLLFFGALQAVSGVNFQFQPIIQLIGGYILPHNPVANMYFTLFGWNSYSQGALLATDQRMAQYAHLAPRITFMCQILGAAIGAVFNWVMTNTIVTNEYVILKSIEGTNIWSGQLAQQFNTLSVAFGGLAHELFSVGGRYEWCTLIIPIGFLAPIPFWLAHKYFPGRGFDYVNTAVLLYFSSYLVVGINSSVFIFYVIGFISQGYIRRRFPTKFIKYNYLVSAALDGGTTVIVFIMTFAIFGAAGQFHQFPEWAGNYISGNFDRCLYTD